MKKNYYEYNKEAITQNKKIPNTIKRRTRRNNRHEAKTAT